MQNIAPYIGVTGFMSYDEVKAVHTLYPGWDYLKHRSKAPRLMIGVLISWKSLRDLTVDTPTRYPARIAVSGLLSNHPKALNLIHYNTGETDTLLLQLAAMRGLFCDQNATRRHAGPLHGFQLNIAWPPTEVLRAFQLAQRDKQHQLVVVLQIGSRALEQIGNNPEELVKKLLPYEGLVDSILLDRSGGKGMLMRPNHLVDLIGSVSEAKLGMGIGIAGGLCAAASHVIEPILRQYPQTSIDAEGQLRTAEDHLDTRAATDYVEAALKLYEEISR